MTHRSAQPYTSTPVEAFEAATDWVNDLGSPEDFPLPRTHSLVFVTKTTLFVDPVGRDFLYLNLRGGLQATVYVNSGKGQQAASSIGLQIDEIVVRG